MATASQDPCAGQRELLDERVETRAEINRLEARAAALLAQRIEVMDADVAAAPVHREAIRRSMVAEYSAAGRMATGSVEHAFADARALRDDFPALRASYAEGRVTAAHVREVIRSAIALTQAIDAGEATGADWALYEAAALEFAVPPFPPTSTPTSSTRPVARRQRLRRGRSSAVTTPTPPTHSTCPVRGRRMKTRWIAPSTPAPW